MEILTRKKRNYGYLCETIFRSLIVLDTINYFVNHFERYCETKENNNKLTIFFDFIEKMKEYANHGTDKIVNVIINKIEENNNNADEYKLINMQTNVIQEEDK